MSEESDRQKVMDWIQSLESKPENSFRIGDILKKGTGCIAQRDLSPGTHLLEEECLFSVPKNIDDLYQRLEIISKEFTKLNSEQTQMFRSLCCAPGKEPTMLNIFDTNSCEMGRKAGIFPEVSRINHDCVPNAYWYWHEESQRLRVSTVKRIAMNDEITISYECNAFKTRRFVQPLCLNTALHVHAERVSYGS